LREVLKDVKRIIIYIENNINAISGSNIRTMENKTCYKCKKELPISNYGKLKSSKDGYRYDCKLCRKEYRENNKQSISDKQKQYYEENKARLIEKNKLYRIENSEK
jgi:hypothetical protein